MRVTSKHVVAAFALLILSWVLFQPAFSAGPEAKPANWEYKVDTNAGMVAATQLNSAGADGWELVSVVVESTGNCSAIFKRAKH
jgi:hypothetical protein